MVLNGDVEAVKTALEESSETGMLSFDAALHNLYKEGAITMENALNYADSRANLEARIHFG
jgi:twitching motility protein PilU